MIKILKTFDLFNHTCPEEPLLNIMDIEKDCFELFFTLINSDKAKEIDFSEITNTKLVFSKNNVEDFSIDMEINEEKTTKEYMLCNGNIPSGLYTSLGFYEVYLILEIEKFGTIFSLYSEKIFNVNVSKKLILKEEGE